MNELSREEYIRSSLSFEEVLSTIEKNGGRFYPDSHLDAWDQLLVYESLNESTPISKNTKNNGNVNGVLNDTCKHIVKFQLNESKLQVLSKLKECNYRTQPLDISELLKYLFDEWPSKENHWLYISQTWAPRAINRTLDYMVKVHNEGRKTIQNPSAYFTFQIKFRKKRK